MPSSRSATRNIELRITYVGTAYRGWQVQPHAPTVQGVLTRILRHILQEPDLRTVGCSRTDSGVHAHDQRVGFQTRNPIPLVHLRRALNHHLPCDIRVLDGAERGPDFSARHAPAAKSYSYIIYNTRVINPLVANYGYRITQPLDETMMNQAAQCFTGEKCFRMLQSPKDAREESITHVYQTRVQRVGSIVHFDVLGHRFLYRMVRNMTGAILKVGMGEWTIEELRERLDQHGKFVIGLTKPPEGLHLFRVYDHGAPLELGEHNRPFLEHIAGLLDGTPSPFQSTMAPSY